jgi:hypothetical protein
MNERKRFIEKEAFERGYRITKEGQALNPSGIEIGFISNQSITKYYVFNIRQFSDRRTVCVKVHRLQAFQKFGDKIYENGIVVRHKDDDSFNNNWDNILIGTDLENSYDKSKEKRILNCKGSTKINQKYSQELIDEIRTLYNNGAKQFELVKKFNIPKSTIHHILNTNYLDERIQSGNLLQKKRIEILD